MAAHQLYIFQWDGGGREVFVVGSFNNWEKVPVNQPCVNGVCVALDLPPGTHNYMFIVDGVWKNDPTNILPITSTGHNQVMILNDLKMDNEVNTQASGSDEDSDFDAYSTFSDASSLRGEATAKLYLRFPVAAKDHVKKHFQSFGYGNNIISFHPFNTSSSCVTMTPSSVGAEVIEKLNGSLILEKHRLIVKPYIRKKSDASKTKSKVGSNTESVGCPDASSGVRIFFGSKLPEYTNEQHIQEHFKRFSSGINKIELIRDKKTKKCKGFGFIEFSNPKSASAAIRYLNNSELLGTQIKVSPDKRERKGSSLPLSPPCDVSNAPPDFSKPNDDDLSDTESVSSTLSAYRDKVKVFVHSRPKFPDSLQRFTLKNHFKEFKSSITSAFVVKDRKTKRSRGFGLVFFSSLDAANSAIQKMVNTKVSGQYKIISMYIENNESKSVNRPLPSGTLFSTDNATCGGSEQPLLLPANSQLSDCVIIENIDPSFSESEVRSLINVPMLSFNRLLPPSSGVKIKLHSPEDARIAVQALNGRHILGKCVRAYVTVSDASHPSQDIFHPPLNQGHPPQDPILSQPEGNLRDYFMYGVPSLSQGYSAPPQQHFQRTQSIPATSQGHFNLPGATGYSPLSSPDSKQHIHSSRHVPMVDGKVVDPNDYEEILRLEPSKWNKLMHVNESSGTTLFEEIMSPFNNNPHVNFEHVLRDKTIRFRGKFDAVRDAYTFLQRNMNKDLTIDDRAKMGALVCLKPSLPDEIKSRHGVNVFNYSQGSTSIRFDGPMLGIEKAHSEISGVLSNLIKKEVNLEREYELAHLEEVRRNITDQIFILPSDSVPRKSLILCCFDRGILDNVESDVVQLLSVNVVPLECKDEESIYLKCFNRAYLSKLPVKVTYTDDGVMLSGGADEVKTSANKIHAGVLAGLFSKKCTYTCNPKFQSQIEEVILKPHELEEPSFRYIVKSNGQSRREKQRKKSCQGKAEVPSELNVYIFCKNHDVFLKLCQDLDRLNPSSRNYHMPHKDANKVIIDVKAELENEYFVRIVESKASSVLIYGLFPEETQKCYDRLKETVETSLVITKYIPLTTQMYHLLKLYQAELDELRRDCSEIHPLPPNKEHETGLIRIKGSICQVNDVSEKLSAGLLNMNISNEQFNVLCPSDLFGMWRERWIQIKQQEEKRSKIHIHFVKDVSTAPNAVNIKFEITGTDEVGIQEVKYLIKGIETEEKVITLSPGGINCLLKAKKEKNLQFLKDVIINIRHIDKSSRCVTICAPKELSDNLDSAEEQIRKFVGDRANTSHVICSKDPVVSLILSSQARSMLYIASANAIAKSHGASVHVLKKPSVGLRINGTESSIASVKSQIYSSVITAIEKTISEKKVTVKGVAVPFLSTPEFLRFQSKLETDLFVSCSHPKVGKSCKIVCSSLLQLSVPGSAYVKVDVCKGNLVFEQVDVIVNAANEELKHIGGLAKAILDAGGPTIQTESDDFVRNNRQVMPGKAVCLGGGDLPCKKVIHAVGPRWMGGQQNEEQILYFAIFESLRLANSESFTSIAFPAISTGIFGVPEDICGRASLKAVRDYFCAHPVTSIQNVKFVLFQQSVVDVFKPLLTSGACGQFQYGNSITPHRSPSRGSRFSISPHSSSWQWYNDQGSFVYYSNEVSRQLSSAHQTNPQGSCKITINGVHYTVDFATMMQINDGTGHGRPITQTVAANASDVQWLYKDGPVYLPYIAEDSKAIEDMYQTKMPGRLIIHGNVYTFDFHQMCQINISTSFKRSIKRQLGSNPPTKQEQVVEPVEEIKEPEKMKDIVLVVRGPYENLPAAEVKITEKLKDCVKTNTIDTLPKNMTADMEKKICQIAGNNNVFWSFEAKVKDGKPYKVLKLEGIYSKLQAAINAVQELILNFHVASAASEEELTFPPEWQQQTVTTQLFPLSSGTPEWQHVASKFSTTMSGNRINKIDRIQNKWLWEKYVTHKKRLERKNNQTSNEMELFHGTRGNDPRKIYEGEDGFDMRYCRQGMWGMANYFAVNASYSDAYAYQSVSGKQMFLVKVLTGDSYNCIPDNSLRMPPEKNVGAHGEVQISQMKYDTVTGHTKGSQVFMTYDNDKAYPAYLITYN